MITRRTFLLGGAGGAVAAAGATGLAYRAAMAQAEARVSAGSEVIRSRSGALEYAVAGDGPPVLMIHGTGGGFDQGLSFTRRLAAMGWRIVSPSRFGYLRSDFPADAGSAAQADAFVDLLDHLGIASLPVLGGSAGALSAIEFAIRHPGRCAALLPIVPATYAPRRPTAQPLSPLMEAAMTAMLRSDFLFWATMVTAPDVMIGSMLATDPDLVRAASPDERARVHRILGEILPISRRTRGLVNDARLAGNPAPADLGAIRAPTLAISVEDDRFGTYDAAKHLAASVPGARFVGYPTGGHVWVGRDEALFGEVHSFLSGIGRAGTTG